MRPARGFSLIEVIVAFALLAAALAILIAILGGGLAQVRTAGDASIATLHAESLLAERGALGPIEAGEESGEFEDGRYRWTLEVSEVEDPAPAAVEGGDESPIETVGLQGAGEPALYRLQLEVAWGEGAGERRLRFASLRARYPQAPLEPGS